MAENLAEALGRNTPPCEMIESLRQELHNDRQEPIAIFTGAGASVLFGYPLTGALLPQIVEWQDNKDFLCIGMDRDRAIGAKRRRLLRTALEALIPNVPRKPGDFPLVTTLLSIIDLAIAQRQPLWSGFDVSQLRQIRSIFDQAIVEALKEDEPFTVNGQRDLRRYGCWLRDLRGHGRDVGIITTNYDVSSNWAVLVAAFPDIALGEWDATAIAKAIDYGMEWLDPSDDAWMLQTRPPEPHFRCYKLHGSTNWLRCPVCQQVYVNEAGSIWHQAFRAKIDDLNSCHCSRTKLDVQIVSPSFVRQMQDVNLLSIWTHAQSFLSRARHWVIIGYSLPEEDISIRALFVRAMRCRATSLKDAPLRVTVIQHGEKDRAKYETLFGGNDCRLEYVADGLGPFLDQWNVSHAQQ